MIRIAAAGDIHFDRNSKNRLVPHFQRMREQADVLLLAGDLTQTGHPDEAEVLANELRECPIPVIAVLGNHDYHSNQVRTLCEILQRAKVHLLERSSLTLTVNNCKIGVAGAKGFGGGFVGACGSEFGEEEMKMFIYATRLEAQSLESELRSLDVHYKVALLHYSPITQTLTGERKEIYPFLGSYFLAEAIDRAGADLVFHGHAHRGIEKGETPGGIPVRNVAQPVIRHAFNVYVLDRQSAEMLRGPTTAPATEASSSVASVGQ